MVAVAALAEIGFPGPLDWRRIIGTFLDDSESSSVAAPEHGDRRRFGRLVEQHKRSVYGLCLRLLRDPEEAKDAAQEAFARAYASRDSYDGALPFAPWVLRIARNHCLDLLRRRPEPLEPLPAESDPAQPRQPEPADPSAVQGDAAVERAELRTSLEAAIAALPVGYREVIHLFHVEQLSYREIAEVMGAPIGTIMTWLHRARAQLRTALRAEGVSP